VPPTPRRQRSARQATDRRHAAFITSALIVGAAAACSSTPDATSPSTTAAAGGVASGDKASATIDPCQWYTAAEMSALAGVTVTMEKKETPQGLGSECLYESKEKFTGLTVRPVTSASHDQLKAGAKAAGIGGAQIAFPGIGDDAYHNGAADKPNPSVSFSAKKGTNAIQVELATASSGPVGTVTKGIEITSTIAKKALG